MHPSDDIQYCVSCSAEIKPSSYCWGCFALASKAVSASLGKGWRLWGIFHPPKIWVCSGPLQSPSLGCQLRSRKAEHWEEGFAGGVHSISVPLSPCSLVWDEDGSHSVTTAGVEESCYCPEESCYCPVAVLLQFGEVLLSAAPSGCLLLPSSERLWCYNGEGTLVSLGGAKKTSEKSYL